jgi:hypothetical protein
VPGWRIRERELGRTSLEFTLQGGIVLGFELYDGGGFVASIGMWWLAGRVVGVVEGVEA